MTQTNLRVATVVLVHAAWADASSWNKIIPPLQRGGLQARCRADPIELAVRRRHNSTTIPQKGERASGVGGSLLRGCGHHGCG